MEGVIIRAFNHTIEDARQIKEIDGATFADCHYFVEEIINIARKEENKIYVAEYDGSMIGFISLLHVHTLHYDGLWVDLIAVHPKYQNKGIAGKLLEQGKVYGQEIGADFVSGLVAVNNYASQKSFRNHDFCDAGKDFQLLLWKRA
ncbi:MAG: GNAT family N-acetyltransferase [Bacillota bacterium]